METLKLIRVGSQGQQVKNWQYFLIGKGFYDGVVDGDFGPLTLEATMAFQRSLNLEPDGIVGNKSYGAAMQLNYNGIIDGRKDKYGPDWPAKPQFPPLVGNTERQKIFGKFSFKSAPLPSNKENIVVTDNWVKDNIIAVPIPQLKPLGHNSIYFHKKAAEQLKNMWQEWENEKLLPLILSYAGSFVSRYVRGSRTTLSNHAFGSAFDINVPWNSLGVVPAFVNQKGSVRELVSIANNNGFYWGGHFSRLDGMHFEVAKVF